MNNEIPEMTDPLSRYWKQPDRSEILVDDTHAIMTKKTFEKLANYSMSNPTGIYEGKMWRSEYKDGWCLRWVGFSDIPEKCFIMSRKIILE